MKRTEPSVSGPLPPTPIPNSYWVEPGRLLAGEYPGSMSRAEALGRVQSLLRAGVNGFVDLTLDGEMPPYDVLLPKDERAGVTYARHGMLDHDVPESPEVMADALDTIAAQLAAGRCVYVHCRAGIGRTGMTVACHLTRSGLNGENALARLQELWQQCARSRSWPIVPETDAQASFVRTWSEPPPRSVPAAVGAGPASFARRCEGALVGLAVGEAFALACANGGPAASQGEWAVPDVLLTGADTAMTMCVAESLLTRGGYSAEDHMHRYAGFIRGARPEAPIANLSQELKRAVAAWQWSRKAEAGTHDPKNLDANSLPRTLAVALYARAEPAAAIDLAVQVSRTTQQSPVVLDAVRLWAALLMDALAGVDKAVLLDPRQGGPNTLMVRQRNLRKELERVLDGRWSSFAPNEAGAIAAIARALLSLREGADFLDGLRHLVSAPAQSGAPVTTTAASGSLYGSLAGALCGVDAIPEAWRRALPQWQALRQLSAQFTAP